MFFFVNFLHLHFARRHPCQKLSSGSFSKWLGEPVASSKLHASWCLRTPDTVISHFMHFMWFVWFVWFVWFDKFDFCCFCFASGSFTCILWFYACWYSTTLMNCTTYLHIATWSHATGPGRNHWPRVCSAGFGPCPRSLQSNWNSQHVSWICCIDLRLYVFKTPSGEGLQGAHSKCHQLFAKLFCNSSIVYEIVLTIV